MAEENESDRARCVVTHVDFKPPFADAGEAAMRRHAEALRSAPGFVRVEVAQQTARANHFELITLWESDAAYEAHLASDETVAFRTEVYPYLGSPWDDRIHRVLLSVPAP
jgi:quinol monooxygenase YgiN